MDLAPDRGDVDLGRMRDAVLVDTLVTIDDANALADWVEAKGRVTTIYVTHEHADHYLGAPVLLARFPGSRLVSTQTVVELIRPQLATAAVEEYWRPMFGIETLRGVAGLHPEIVIAAHRRPDAVNGPQALDESIAYIEDMDRLCSTPISVGDLIQGMLALHGDRLNITTLYHVAYALAGAQ